MHLLHPTALATSSEWDAFVDVSGPVIGIVGVIIAAVGIIVARRQASRHEATTREQREQDRRAAEERDRKIANREGWRTDHEQIRELLDRGSTLGHQVRHDGPFSGDGFDAIGLAAFRIRAEQLSSLGVEPLREPLLRLADLAERLGRTAVPADHGRIPSSTTLTITRRELLATHRLAVAQDRAAQELIEEVGRARQALRDEWGA
ncbi:hypothetical protein Val02_37690 [Virgisporangium aliadipatigenens]|uniref:Uncharacterized protein n=1 Tax=Virgisporangium aliadipatigenens TaxID=741659 RepID=A0A8J3YNF3_9ACTN|nr:hypothetical protein [Virgisporangium aliadipatigenens]GIJ46883.1 hypothetical protein Val02_37690 [Virgisporangium aliadipatigenens]